MINEKFAAIGDQLNEKLGRILAEQTDDVQSGGVRTVVRKQQNAQADAIFENQPKSLRRTATSGAKLVADPEKTTTVLGRFGDDMEEIITKLRNLDTGELTGFGREYECLVSNGYVYDPATNMMVRSK